ncbi:MAG: YihY/virulence factor BrkB family protein [Actinomycetota bacterium]
MSDTGLPRRWRSGPTVLARVVRSTVDDRITGLGAEVAFFLLLSFPPALLAIMGSIGWGLMGPEVVDRLRDQILTVGGLFLTEETVVQILNPAVDQVLAEGRAAVVSVGIVLSLWSASRATTRTMDAVSIAYDVQDPRPGWKRRLLALVITVVGMLAVVVVLPILVAGPRFLETLSSPLGITEAVAAAWRVLYWPLVALLGIGLLGTFFHLTTPWRTPWRRDLPGATLAAVLWLAGGAALRFYASRFLDIGVFGPLAAPVVFLLWLYVTAVAVLVGAEVNAEIEKAWPTRGSPHAPGTPVPQKRGRAA